MGSFKKFKEIKLPDTDCFFSSLKDRGISDKEYQRACDVWKVFKIKNLGFYHDIYIKQMCCYCLVCMRNLLVFV